MIGRRTVLASTGAVAALSVAPALRAAAGLSVVTTTGMIADAARVVGGARVDVTGLMGPGIDPHSFRPTRTDIAAAARADLVLWHGLFLEAQMEDLLRDLEGRGRAVAVGEAVPEGRLLADPEYDGRFDPHVWMDPRLWADVVGAVEAAFAGADPAGAEAYAAAAAAAQDELAGLHAYSAEVLASVPSESRVLVTAHDAFGYFGAAYGFEVEGIQGISTESEAGLRRIAALVDLLVARNIRAVFVESSVAERNVQALIEGAAAKGHAVAIGGTLYSDAMGPVGTYEGTYLGMIDHNVTLIARALGGDAPIRGWLGRLGEES